MANLSLIPVINIVDSNGALLPVWLNWFNSVYRFLNKAPAVSSGIVAPTSTPNKIGDIYVDTVHKKIYVAIGSTSSADWQIVN